MTSSAIYHPDTQYTNLLRDIQNNGTDKEDRTGVGSRSVFGRQMRFDLKGGKLPLLTTKKVFTKGIIHELLWMLSGDTNVRYLKQHGVSIWDSWVKPETAVYEVFRDEHGVPQSHLIAGELPKIYQHQWRQWEDTRIVAADELNSYESQGYKVLGEISFGQYVVQRHIDQIQQVVEQLKSSPDSRRIVVSAWNVAQIDEMALPPCHTLFQFWTRELSFEERKELALEKGFLVNQDPQVSVDGVHLALDKLNIPRRALSCQLYMRSNDVPLGNPFNLVQYALLTHLVAHVTGMVAEEFIWTGGDVHVYQDQWEGVEEQLSRKRMENIATVHLNKDVSDIFDFTFEDIKVSDYESHPAIKFPQAAV